MTDADPPRDESVGGALRFLWRFMSPRRRWHFAATLLLMLLGAVGELLTIGAVIPFLAILSDPSASARLPFVATFVGSIGLNPANLILPATLLFIAAAIVGAITRILLVWASHHFVLALSHEISRCIYSRLLSQPYAFFVMRNTSIVLAGIEKIHPVIWSVLLPAMQGVTSAFIALTIMALLLYIDPFSALTAAIIVGASYLVISLLVQKRLSRNSWTIARKSEQRMKILQESLGGMRDIILDQSQEVFERKFVRTDYDYRKTLADNNFITLAPRFVVEAIGVIVIGLLALIWSSREGGIMSGLPVLGALALGAQRLLPLLQQSYVGWSSFTGSRQLLLDVVEQMQLPVRGDVRRDRSVDVIPFTAEVTFDRVGFDYPVRGMVLDDVNLTIRKGDRVGIVGVTGSGKSTFLDILMGLLEPTRGRIQIDGVELDDRNRARWQAQIAHVPQVIYLADASLRSNIAFGIPEDEVDEERVAWAARLAQLDEFVRSLPKGFDTDAGERGVRLSGGQRQRIGIARALYRRPKVLVLDEATSALDSETEAKIIAAISGLEGDVTVLMVAHRTSTLANCDYIVRVNSGGDLKIVSASELSTTAGENLQ